MSESPEVIVLAKLELLRNLAEIYSRTPAAARDAISVSYLLEVAEVLALHFDDERPLQPLVDMIERLASPVQAKAEDERRSGDAPPSAPLMGRLAATLDVMVEGRFAAATAAQIIARQMLRAGVEMPSVTGDSRAWMRLVKWTERLRTTEKPPEAWKAYRDFKVKLLEDHGPKVALKAMSEPLWDFRR